jgi:hypothetical protein
MAQACKVFADRLRKRDHRYGVFRSRHVADSVEIQHAASRSSIQCSDFDLRKEFVVEPECDVVGFTLQPKRSIPRNPDYELRAGFAREHVPVHQFGGDSLSISWPDWDAVKILTQAESER